MSLARVATFNFDVRMFFHCIQKEKVCTSIKKTAPIIGLNEIDLVQTTKRFCRRPMFRSTFERHRSQNV